MCCSRAISTCAHDGKYLHAKGCQMDVEKVDQLSQTKEARRLPILTILTLHHNEPGDDHPHRVEDGRSSKISKNTATIHYVQGAHGVGLKVVPSLGLPHRGTLGFPGHPPAVFGNQRVSTADSMNMTYKTPEVVSHS